MNTTQNRSSDPFRLERFLKAQERSYETAVAELKRGCKYSHWMWYIFPQFDGLGYSPTAKLYAIKSKAEADAYLDHEILGARLYQCTNLVNQIEGQTAAGIFGFPDDPKLRSCMTLFAAVAENSAPFTAVLDKYYQGEKDAKTLQLLASSND